MLPTRHKSCKTRNSRGRALAGAASLLKTLRVFRQFFSVGGFTALSRLTGFLREMAISALMGAGPLADAYFVALRLPNQFRAIFGEGAFNSAYVPTYSRLLTSRRPRAARALFASRVLTLLALSQTRAAGARLSVHAAARRADRARLLARPREIRRSRSA